MASDWCSVAHVVHSSLGQADCLPIVCKTFHRKGWWWIKTCIYQRSRFFLCVSFRCIRKIGNNKKRATEHEKKNAALWLLVQLCFNWFCIYLLSYTCTEEQRRINSFDIFYGSSLHNLCLNEWLQCWINGMLISFAVIILPLRLPIGESRPVLAFASVCLPSDRTICQNAIFRWFILLWCNRSAILSSINSTDQHHK